MEREMRKLTRLIIKSAAFVDIITVNINKSFCTDIIIVKSSVCMQHHLTQITLSEI